jgi:hypothetical protein
VSAASGKPARQCEETLISRGTRRDRRLLNPFANGVFDGTQTDIDRWITYGTQTTNTFSVQAIDSAGNRSPASSVTLDNQPC